MVDQVTGNSDSPWERILLDIARPILESDDIRQALAQAETDADALHEMIRSQSSELILSAPATSLEFVQKFSLKGKLLSRSVLKFAGALFLAVAAAAAIDVGPWRSPYWGTAVCDFLFALIGGFSFSFVLVSVDSLVGPLEPTADTREELAREVLGPLVREEINRMLDEQEHPAVMHVMSAPGLSELASRERLVATQALRALGRLSRDMSSGSIGVSGPRGVGKTTLLRYFCDPSFEAAAGNRDAIFTAQDLRFIVAAPVNYDARDFILHVFSKLCGQVLEFESTRRRGRGRLRGGQGVRRMLPVVLVAALAVAAFFVPSDAWPRAFGRLSPWTATAIAVLGGIVVAQALLSWWSPRRISHLPGKMQSLQDEARSWQMSIRYAHTFTAGSSSSVGLPRGLQFGVSSAHQIEETPITLPELVEAMRDFATRVIHERQRNFRSWHAEVEQISQWEPEQTWRPSRLSEVTVYGKAEGTYDPAGIRNQLLDRYTIPDLKPRMVIGIDEIDKMDPDSAKRFLNDVKAIFGMPDCLYLVSVSDEALQIYEQRILLGRTAFDSAFDEIARVHPLDFESCRHLLRRRIAGIPDSMIAFCEVMSGGVPRDMIRAARSVLDARVRGRVQIADIVLDLVVAEIDALKRTSITDFVGAGGSVTRFPGAALRHDWPGHTSDAMLTAIEKGLPDGAFSLNFHTGLYFYATVAEAFSSELPETIRLLRHHQPVDDAHIDQLAQARNAISINPAVAWEMVSQFRVARGLRKLKEPEPDQPHVTFPIPAHGTGAPHPA